MSTPHKFSGSKILWRLQYATNFAQKACAIVAIAGTVVGRQAGDNGRHHTQLAVPNPRPLADATKADQRHLGWIDHAQHTVHTLVAELRDRHACVAQLRTAQGAIARAFHQTGEFTHHLCQWLIGDIVQCGSDQTTLAQGDRYAQMNPGCRLESVVLPETTELRQLTQGYGSSRRATATALSSKALGNTRCCGLL